jgi:hypothetical protein
MLPPAACTTNILQLEMTTLVASVSEAPKLIDDNRVVLYDRNMFMVHATGDRNWQLIDPYLNESLALPLPAFVANVRHGWMRLPEMSPKFLYKKRFLRLALAYSSSNWSTFDASCALKL